MGQPKSPLREYTDELAEIKDKVALARTLNSPALFDIDTSWADISRNIIQKLFESQSIYNNEVQSTVPGNDGNSVQKYDALHALFGTLEQTDQQN